MSSEATYGPIGLLSAFALALLLVTGCGKQGPAGEAPAIQDEAPLFRMLEAEETGLTFVNELPVDLELNIFNYMYYYNGGGVAVADFNKDGLADILFTSNLGPERLFLNEGRLKFKDVTDLTSIDGGPGSWTTGVSVADINADGWPDVYLCQVGSYRNLDTRNKLFIGTGLNGNGIPQFREAAEEFGLAYKGFSTMSGFFDYDLDGDLDMYLLNHSLHHNGTFGPRERFMGVMDSLSGDRLFRNDGGTFTDVTAESGIHSMVIGYGLGLAFGDVNFDGYPDIYIGNDFHENDYLYINRGDGTFQEDINQQVGHTSRFSMGVDVADINNDQYPEIISLDMLPEDPVILKRSEGENALDIFNFKLKYGYNHQYAKNALQLNNGNGTFSEIAQYAGVFATDWSWSPLLFDFNLDGKRDLFITNGIPKRMNDLDYIDFMRGNDLQYKIQFDQLTNNDLEAINQIPEIKLMNKFYLQSEEMRFSDVSQRVDNNLDSYSNAAAYADFDNDGDLDLVVNNINDPAFLYENVSNPDTFDFLKITLEGPPENPEGIGSKVLVFNHSGSVQYAEAFQVRGFQSSFSSDLTFARTGKIDSVQVVWPDRTYMKLDDPGGATLHATYQPELPVFRYALGADQYGYLVESHASEMGIEHSHQENRFVEFNREVLIPHATSTDGPALAVGDLNADGLEDIFIGSSKRTIAALFYQQPDGKFLESRQDVFEANSVYEEVDAKIADLNGDGICDLVVATGGNEYRVGSEYTRPLLYLGSRSGNLKFVADAFEEVSVTASCVEILDINGDGAPDLFIGGRAVPWQYGKRPSSHLLVNDGMGKFKDETETYCKSLVDLGFVKGSSVADIDRNGFDDIILAMEWDAVVVLYQNTSGFEANRITEGKGWWNCVLPVDVNQDGLPDILAGNQGLNHRLQCNAQNPVRMYYADFDENGTHEQLVTHVVAGKEVSLHSKKELEKQLPFIRKNYTYADDFAGAGIRDIFPASKLRNAFEANCFESMLLINEGNGSFKSVALPKEVQFTPMRTAVVCPEDLQAKEKPGSGTLDVLLHGNYYDAHIQLGRHDASFGTVVSFTEDGSRQAVQPMHGTVIGGQVRKILPISVRKRLYYVIARNNERLEVISLTKIRSDSQDLTQQITLK